MAASIARVLRGRAPVGVRFVEHTADAAIEVRARSMEGCFARAAAGMFAIFVAPARTGASMHSVELEVSAAGAGELLVAWLDELLYLSEVRDLALQAFTVTDASRKRVTGSAQGARFSSRAVLGPAVKGISRHGLELRQSRMGWFARLIFDV